MTGISVSDECVQLYNELKLGHKHKYVTFKIDDNTVVPDQIGEAGTDWDQFTGVLPDDECRYAIYDFTYTIPDGDRAKITFIMWYVMFLARATSPLGVLRRVASQTKRTFNLFLLRGPSSLTP